MVCNGIGEVGTDGTLRGSHRMSYTPHLSGDFLTEISFLPSVTYLGDYATALLLMQIRTWPPFWASPWQLSRALKRRLCWCQRPQRVLDNPWQRQLTSVECFPYKSLWLANFHARSHLALTTSRPRDANSFLEASQPLCSWPELWHQVGWLQGFCLL